jgi:hypothetical protein
MTTPERIDAERAALEYTGRERLRNDTIQGVLGDGGGKLNVPGRMGWLYVRLHGDPNRVVTAWCPTSIPMVEGLVVDLQRTYSGGRSFYKIEGRSAIVQYGQDPFFSSGISGTVGAHAQQHQRKDFGAGGFDPLDIYTRALVSLRATPQFTPDMTVQVAPGYYYINGLHKWEGGNSPAFDPIAGGNLFNPHSRFDLLYLGADGALHIIKGTEVAGAATIDPSVVPANCIPIAYIFFSTNQTTITESQIVDARVILAAATTSSGYNAPADAPYVLWQNQVVGAHTTALSNVKFGPDILGPLEAEMDLTMSKHML